MFKQLVPGLILLSMACSDGNNAKNANNANNANNGTDAANNGNNRKDVGIDVATSDAGTDVSISDAATDDGASGDTDDDTTANVETTLALDFTAFIGGNAVERVQGVFVDEAGSVFVAGTTGSVDFPTTPGVYERQRKGLNRSDLGRDDGFVAKFDSNGQLVWSTLIGGTWRDSAYGVRTDSAGNVYVVGSTGSDDFPTTAGAYDRTLGGTSNGNQLLDGFVASFTADGSTLRWSTFIGGGGNVEENPRGAIKIDEANNRIFIAGMTMSTTFPTTNGVIQPTYGGGDSDGFVAALSINGQDLLAATYIGGRGGDMAYSSIELAPDGSLYIAGATNSLNFPVTNGAYETERQSGSEADPWWQSGDGWVARLSADLQTNHFTSYLGGDGTDAVNHNQGLAVDPQGRLVVVGTTTSTLFPVTPNAFSQTNAGGVDLFVSIFNVDGSLAYSSLVGTIGDDYASGVNANVHGVFISGAISSSGLPVSDDAAQTDWNAGADDSFLFGFDPTLSSIQYSTYLGGTSNAGGERGRSVWATDSIVAVAGTTDSADFPGAIGQFSGGTDGFISVFDVIPK